MIYVVSAGARGREMGLYGVTLSRDKAIEMCEEAEVFFHECYGLEPCMPDLFWLNGADGSCRYSSHVKFTILQDGQTVRQLYERSKV